MADELKGAIDQLKTDVAAITGVQRAQLGQLLSSANEATKDKCVAAIYMMAGAPRNDALTSTSEYHIVHIRMYWLITPMNVEVVEQSMASMWDLLMEKLFDDDGDRNLTETCTLGMISGEDGIDPYECAYEVIDGKQHRIMIVPFEIILDTHEVE